MPNIKKILLTGGGTGGSVSPLLAIYDELTSSSNLPLAPSLVRSGKQKNIPLLTKEGQGEVLYKFIFVGTKNGPEKSMVQKENIEFLTIPYGKLRRYFSWKNFVDPIFIIAGFLKSLLIIIKFQPDVVISAGSFSSVPVVWAAWLLRIPVLIHQQDVRPGLANKLMAPFAKVITVTFEKSLQDYGQKAVWTGNIIRLRLKIKNQKSKIKSNLNNDLPTLLVVGGGTGSGFLNKLVEKSLSELIKFCQIIHITGKNKNPNYQLPITNYQYFEFLNTDDMIEALNKADVVVSRCGMSALTELSYLHKSSILIPMPDTHQEDNAEIFKAKEAAVILNQKELSSKDFVEKVKRLLHDQHLRNKLGQNIKNVIKIGNNEVVEMVEEMAESRK
jgi:UDP-N-acetylglucosamine--N-acetylmuramyl-(pentapeptide) pyrophosphoryl-undecaprenol N-acetylglucosamine transferase